MMLHDPHTNRLFFINKENLQANSVVRSQDSSLPISPKNDVRIRRSDAGVGFNDSLRFTSGTATGSAPRKH